MAYILYLLFHEIRHEKCFEGIAGWLNFRVKRERFRRNIVYAMSGFEGTGAMGMGPMKGVHQK